MATIAGTLLTVLPCFAGPINPINLTGWNADVIAEAAAPNPASAVNANVVGFDWYETGAPSSTRGLPVGGSFVSLFDPDTTFEFQPYTSNNVVNHDGTLTFASPESYMTLAFLTSSQGGDGQSFSATLHFSDNSSDILTGNDPDWTASGQNAIENIGLTNDNSSWGSYYSGPLNMFEHDFTLSSADQSKAITSIDFATTSGNTEDLFAVSGTVASAAPEPRTFVLFGAGLVVFTLSRRRSRLWWR